MSQPKFSLSMQRRGRDPIAKREEFEKSIQSNNPWRRSELGLEAEKAAMAMMGTKHGLYAQVPIYCKGESCPYSFQCELLAAELAPIGERCPIESARIAAEYAGYANDFDIDSGSQTDKVLMSEIISMDIMAARATALMAKEKSPVQEVAIGVDDNGEKIMQPAVSKAWEAYNAISRRRNEMLQLMMATRRDKQKNGNNDQERTAQDILAEVISSPDFDKVETRPSYITESNRTELK